MGKGGFNFQEEKGTIFYVDSMWLSRGGTISKEINGLRVERSINVGLTMKATDRVASRELYERVQRAVNNLVEEEKERWLNERGLSSDEKEIRDNLSGENNGTSRSETMEALLHATDGESEDGNKEPAE
jgi:hypothetical protein